MITCYAEPEKKKSVQLIEAFAAGCGGRVASTWSPRLEPGAAAFYGMRARFVHLLKQARDEARTWYVIDNSWFDVARERQFRVGRSAMQTWSTKPSDGARLKALGVQVNPWRTQGAHIVVTPQSEEYFELVKHSGWLGKVTDALKACTDRPLVVRAKGSARPLAADLKDAWLLVAHSSAAAVEALLAGVPVIVTDPLSAAAGFTSSFAGIEAPGMPDGREEWAARLADSQWSVDELRDGTAWKAVHA